MRSILDTDPSDSDSGFAEELELFNEHNEPLATFFDPNDETLLDEYEDEDVFGFDEETGLLVPEVEILRESEIDRRSRPYISWVQRSLNEILGTRLKVDGLVGRRTRSAVRKFQRRAGITVDGVAGRQTEQALVAAGASLPPGAETPSNTPTAPTTPVGFSPIAVESPGGGRIRDKSPPKRADLVAVSGVGGRRIRLHRHAAQAWNALVGAARADGIPDPLLLPTSGYRDPTHQAVLWEKALKKYGSSREASRWVAPPGRSAHQTGRAIDFYLGAANSSKNVHALRRLPVYKWLVANAMRFGFYPYQREPWHWEYNPPALISPIAVPLPNGFPALTGPKIPAGFKVVKRRGVPRGLARYGGGRLDEKLISMTARGTISVSNDEIDTFQRIANIETRGEVQGINTWDSAVVSIGFMQWTLQHGKVQEWISHAEAAFRRYDIELDRQRKYSWGKNKQIAIKGAGTLSELRWDGWAERFFLAGLDDDVIAAEVELAKQWLTRHLRGLKARLRRQGMSENDYAVFKRHYDASAVIRGVFQAAFNNLPAAAADGVRITLLNNRQSGGNNSSRFLQLFKSGIQRAFSKRGHDNRGKNLTTKTLHGARFR